MEEREANERVLGRVEAHRRDFVKRILTGAAFAAPVLATFSIDALTPRSAEAQGLNGGPSPTPEPSTLLLIGTGAVGMGIAAYRKAQRKKDEPSAKTDAAETEGRD
jgi:PEP-CTERM motif